MVEDGVEPPEVGFDALAKLLVGELAGTGAPSARRSPGFAPAPTPSRRSSTRAPARSTSCGAPRFATMVLSAGLAPPRRSGRCSSSTP
jgi:hypothetical protein